MSYQDSGYSEDDPEHQIVTTCLMKTASGNLYMQPSNTKVNNLSLESRLDPLYSQPGFNTHTLPSKDCSLNTERGGGQLKQFTGTLQSQAAHGNSTAAVPAFNMKKDLNFNPCSWKWLAIFFIVLTLAMAATLLFVACKYFWWIL